MILCIKILHYFFESIVYILSNYLFIWSSGAISDLVVHVLPDHNCDSVEIDGIGATIED